MIIVTFYKHNSNAVSKKVSIVSNLLCISYFSFYILVTISMLNNNDCVSYSTQVTLCNESRVACN